MRERGLAAPKVSSDLDQGFPTFGESGVFYFDTTFPDVGRFGHLARSTVPDGYVPALLPIIPTPQRLPGSSVTRPDRQRKSFPPPGSAGFREPAEHL